MSLEKFVQEHDFDFSLKTVDEEQKEVGMRMRSSFRSADVIQKLVSRLKAHTETASRSDLLQLDLKLLFLLSGLDPTVRQELVDRNDVFSLLADLLYTFQPVPLSTKDYQLISDIFKVAYNIGYSVQRSPINLQVSKGGGSSPRAAMKTRSVRRSLRSSFRSADVIQKLVSRLKAHTETASRSDLLQLDLKLLFLLSGLDPTVREGATAGFEEDSAEEYSSASSDSETEEYKRLKDEVNPVTGRWEASRADPMEGMSEEQKEYFAMELVNNIDKLQ
ncbi:hypothetical protein X801_00327, partial [Opisthorchis viverrini]